MVNFLPPTMNFLPGYLFMQTSTSLLVPPKQSFPLAPDNKKPPKTYIPNTLTELAREASSP